MASLATRIILSGQMSVSRRLLHTSRPALAIPTGKEREEYIDQGNSAAVKSMAAWAEKTKTHLSTLTQRYERLHEIYYGKDRDMVNYPPHRIEPHQPKVRIGFLPDSWFQAFYDKTGVLGPYILALGVPTFLISKEFWVLDPEGMVLLVGVPMAVGFIKYFGPRLKALEVKYANEHNRKLAVTPIENAKKSGQELVQSTEAKIEANAVLLEESFKAKREILDLQLEEEYRRRLAEVARTVERRMAYHVDLAAAKKSYQQQHLVQWVMDSVLKAVTPQQEKEAIQQCIRDLKGLAARV